MSRDIPSTKEIKLFFHCRLCLSEKPDGVSAQSYSQIEAGWTELGLQVWCKRHNVNVVHIDFEGQQHPANLHVQKHPAPKV
jgi:hypothetical protein